MFFRSHFVPGTFSIEDLDQLVGTKLATMNAATAWEVSKRNGVRVHGHTPHTHTHTLRLWMRSCVVVQVLCVGDALIVLPDLPALSGYVHVIDRVSRERKRDR